MTPSLTFLLDLPLAPSGHGFASIPPPAVADHDTPSSRSLGHSGAAEVKQINLHAIFQILQEFH